MKKLILYIVIVFFGIDIFAQTAGIPYQAVLLSKDNNNELPGYDFEYSNVLSNTLVSVQFSILDINGIEFTEVHCLVVPFSN